MNLGRLTHPDLRIEFALMVQENKSLKTASASRGLVAKRDNPAQSRAFIKKAREIGADEDLSRADELLGRLAGTPPQRKPSPHEKKQ